MDDASPESVVTSVTHAESNTTKVPASPSVTVPPTATLSSPVTTAMPSSTTTLDLVITTRPATTTPITSPTTAASSTTTTTFPDDVTVVEVTVRDGRAVGEDRVEVPLGNRISLRFDSDARLLVHVHGYDEEFSVEAGVVTVHEFDGDLPGIFEVEDHVSHRRLIELKVSS